MEHMPFDQGRSMTLVRGNPSQLDFAVESETVFTLRGDIANRIYQTTLLLFMDGGYHCHDFVQCIRDDIEVYDLGEEMDDSQRGTEMNVQEALQTFKCPSFMQLRKDGNPKEVIHGAVLLGDTRIGPLFLHKPGASFVFLETEEEVRARFEDAGIATFYGDALE